MLQWLRALLRGKKAAPHRAWVHSPAASANAAGNAASAAVARPTAQGSSMHAVPPVAAPAPAPVAAAPPVSDAEAEARVEQGVAALTEHFASSPPRLGAFPGTAARIMQVFREDEPDFNRVVHELQQDAAVVTKLLNVANSAFFGGNGGTVHDIRGAVLRIGMHDVAQIALGVAGQSLFEASSRSAFALLPAKWNELFHTSMSAAFATSWLSQVARVGRSDQAFLTGLLHDIGQPTALRALAQLVLENTLDRGVLQVADAVLERVHIDIGRSVTTLSGLPEYLCAAASLHHDAEAPPEHAELQLVRVIDGLAARRRAPLTQAQQDVMDRSAVAVSLDPRWIRVAVTEYENLAGQVTRMFGVADPFAAKSDAPTG
jgi:HD-like signal output (HDOD) protein